MHFKSLLADLRLMCPGLPEPWQYRFLTRSLQTFLSETQVWQEWSLHPWDFTAASGGVYAVPNARYNPGGATNPNPTVVTDRVLAVRWVPTGRMIEKITREQADACFPTWPTDTNAEPTVWFPYPSGFAGATVPAVRLYPYPAAVGDNTAGALSFLVSHTVTEAETPDEVYALESAASGNIADWLFRRYRETIVSGAAARALAVPNVDWSNPQLATQLALAFALGLDRARSETQAGQTTSHGVVAYGGY